MIAAHIEKELKKFDISTPDQPYIVVFREVFENVIDGAKMLEDINEKNEAFYREANERSLRLIDAINQKP